MAPFRRNPVEKSRGKNLGHNGTQASDLMDHRPADILLAMSELGMIEEKIRALSPEELAEFRRWFAEFDATAWDRQLEQGVKAGKLDTVADQALRDHADG